MAVAQQVFDDLASVLADQRARQVIRRRRLRKFERRILHLVQSERRMLNRQVHFAVAQLRIALDPIFGALHGKRANPGGLATLR